jgi:hypothetical protein
LAELSLVEKVQQLSAALTKARLPHAFGGALAFAYYGEPRATVDIDLNLFVATDRIGPVMDVLGPLGVAPPARPEALQREGQARLWWSRTPLDLFFSYDPLHDAMAARSRMVPFAQGTICILSPEHLVVAKVAFNRAKDWIDIEQMLVAVEDFDLEETHTWLDRILGPHDDRVRTLREVEHRLLGAA